MKSFIRCALTLAGALAAGAFLHAQTPPVPAAAAPVSGPRIKFNTENCDFGKIIAGEPVKYTFIATNTGDDTLEISNAKGSCSCTVVGEGSDRNAWTPQKVAPGQTCRIPVEIATGNYAGQSINKTVSVTSNDKGRPVVTLQIHGNVWLPVEVTPVAAFFNLTSDTATNSTQVLKIFNRMDTPLSLSDPKSSTNAFSATLKTNVPGQEFELTVTTAAPPLRQSNSFGITSILGQIALKSSVTNMNPLTIGVSENISPEITVYPPSLPLPAGPLAQASTNRIYIRGNSADLTLSAPGANVPGVDVSLNVVQTNRQYYLDAVFPKGFEIRAGQDILLTIKTDNPRYPILSVPVTPMLGAILRRPPVVLPPLRTGVRPASIMANGPANPSNTPVPPSPMRLNPAHP